MIKFISVLLLLIVLPISVNAHETIDYEYISKNPSQYLKVLDWNFYVAARVAIVYGVKIENRSPYTFQDLKIRVNYYSSAPTISGMKISEQRAVLKITVPPNSTETYLRGGYPIGAGSMSYRVKDLDIISAKMVK